MSQLTIIRLKGHLTREGIRVIKLGQEPNKWLMNLITTKINEAELDLINNPTPVDYMKDIRHDTGLGVVTVKLPRFPNAFKSKFDKR